MVFVVEALEDGAVAAVHASVHPAHHLAVHHFQHAVQTWHQLFFTGAWESPLKAENAVGLDQVLHVLARERFGLLRCVR